jgi:hypothetical protein
MLSRRKVILMKARERRMTKYCHGGYRLLGVNNDYAAWDPVTYFDKRFSDSTEKKLDSRGLLPVTYYRAETDRVHYEPVGFERGTNGPTINLVKGKWPSAALPPNHRFVARPSNDELVVKLIADTNPFRPGVSAPLSFVELLDAPELLRKVGLKLIREFGSNFLRWKFGYQTLESDVRTLDNILRDVASRVREFNSLVGAGGLHRRAFLWSGQDQRDWGEYPIESISSVGTWYAHVVDTTTVKVFGSIRWFPQAGYLPPPDPIDAFRAASRTLLDLGTESLKVDTLWNALPFSWLADYFANIGDILAAARGRQLVTPRYISLSVRTSSVSQGSVVEVPFRAYGGNYRTYRDTIERFAFDDNYVPTSVSVNSLLSRSQLEVVGALLLSWQKFL